MPRIEIACTLDDDGRVARGEQWRAVIAEGLEHRESIEGGIRLRFSANPVIAGRVEELVAGERECCSWASWTLRPSDDATVLEATAPGDGAAALRALFELA
jgi:hypothetical protein